MTVPWRSSDILVRSAVTMGRSKQTKMDMVVAKLREYMALGRAEWRNIFLAVVSKLLGNDFVVVVACAPVLVLLWIQALEDAFAVVGGPCSSNHTNIQLFHLVPSIWKLIL